MNAIRDIPSIRAGLPKSDPDPFLRKNPIWFQKTLPPSIGQIKRDQPSHMAHHLDQIALSLLNPHDIERKQFAPAQYHSRLKDLREKMTALDNQIPQTKRVAALLQNESSLSDLFYDQQLSAVPC